MFIKIVLCLIAFASSSFSCHRMDINKNYEKTSMKERIALSIRHFFAIDKDKMFDSEKKFRINVPDSKLYKESLCRVYEISSCTKLYVPLAMDNKFHHLIRTQDNGEFKKFLTLWDFVEIPHVINDEDIKGYLFYKDKSQEFFFVEMTIS